MTKRHYLSTIALIALGGCEAPPMTYLEAYRAGMPFNMFYRGGVSFQRIANDNVDCQVEAAQRVPTQILVSQTPIYTSPASTICSPIGGQLFCDQVGGRTYGGQIQSYDANSELRERAHMQCMARSGYRYVSIPACPAGVDISSQDNEPVLRPLSATTCYQIHEQGFRVGNY
jgi:hypothetical protein